MSTVTKPILLNETGVLIKDQLVELNRIQRAIAGASVAQNMSLAAIHRIVQEGSADEIFSIGDQIMTTWKDKAADTEYDVPLDIVHFDNVELEDGEIVPGMFVQFHYCLPFVMQYDEKEAFYVVPNGGLAAGDYYFNVPAAWSTISAGNYQFTVTDALTEGTQLVLSSTDTTTLIGKNVVAYASATATSATGTYEISSGNSGTYLGELKNAGDTNINGLQQSIYGYNKWSQSALRQFLNSNGGASSWWAKKNPYDRIPTTNITKHGFLTGLSEELLACIQPIKVQTALNELYDDGTLETTYDSVFIPSLSQMHIKSQLGGEGVEWEKWKRQSGSAATLDYSVNYPQMRTYSLENHSSAQQIYVRSAYRAGADYIWQVSASGSVGSGAKDYRASLGRRFSPTMVIC